MEVTINIRVLFNYLVAMLAAVVATIVLLWAMDAAAAPGDDDTTFVPVTPCRLIDTRAGASRVGTLSTFVAEQTRTVQAHGTNGQCTIPADAVALSLNVTALDATTNTFVTVWPSGTRPTSSSLNPQPGVRAFNAVTVKLDAGKFRLFNKAGSLDMIVDVNGYYTASSLEELGDQVADLQERLEALEGVNAAGRLSTLEGVNAASRLSALETKTASMTTVTVDGESVVRFSGVNLQVVSGSGSTDGAVNGTGNLIIGYNESSSDDRTGSHNLVVGGLHSFSSHSGIVVGQDSRISAPYASVSGGRYNEATAIGATVSGGVTNDATSQYATVSGGTENVANGQYSVVSGGYQNLAPGFIATVSGGFENEATGVSSTVSGGQNNTASGVSSAVSGGVSNSATGQWSAIAGGATGMASGTVSSISGGNVNTAAGEYESVVGGDFVNCDVVENAVCGEGSLLAVD